MAQLKAEDLQKIAKERQAKRMAEAPDKDDAPGPVVAAPQPKSGITVTVCVPTGK